MGVLWPLPLLSSPFRRGSYIFLAQTDISSLSSCLASSVLLLSLGSLPLQLCCFVTGSFLLKNFRYSYSCLEGGNKELWSSGHHLKSCREVSFSHDGHSEFSFHVFGLVANI